MRYFFNIFFYFFYLFFIIVVVASFVSTNHQFLPKLNRLIDTSKPMRWHVFSSFIALMFGNEKFVAVIVIFIKKFNRLQIFKCWRHIRFVLLVFSNLFPAICKIFILIKCHSYVRLTKIYFMEIYDWRGCYIFCGGNFLKY